MKKKKPGKDPCWKGYEMVGMKKKGEKTVPNCVPESTLRNWIDIVETLNKSAQKPISK